MLRLLLVSALALLFVAGTWLLVRPSPQQRRLGDIRAAAARKGLRVAVQEDMAGVALGDGEAAYMLGLVPGQPWSTDFSLVRPADEEAGAGPEPGWGGYTLTGRQGGRLDEETLARLRRLLPEVASLHCVRGKGAVAVWTERGALGTLEDIREALQALVELPEPGGEVG